MATKTQPKPAPAPPKAPPPSGVQSPDAGAEAPQATLAAQAPPGVSTAQTAPVGTTLETAEPANTSDVTGADVNTHTGAPGIDPAAPVFTPAIGAAAGASIAPTPPEREAAPAPTPERGPQLASRTHVMREGKLVELAAGTPVSALQGDERASLEALGAIVTPKPQEG